ncbi:MAG: DNA polymerase III subunit gamma/tau [Pseudomonadota bacterium]
MSYQVLARKWRPQTFSELVGQDHVKSAISNALNNDKLHHAYLFTGTRGIGKTTIARIFAKSINCEVGQSDHPCGKCGTCIDIADGRYVDLLEIDAASRTKVEDTRELLDNVQYKPTRGRYKVYLIDEVHMLSKHSFNALLKTLEEPPEHVKFLLATTDPQKLPVTVLSRCLQFNLKQLSKEQITAQLSHILDLENVNHDKQALSLLATAANGSMRDALSLTDQAIAQGNNSIVKDDVVNMLGLLDNTLILKIVKSLIDKDHNACFQLFEQLCADAPDFNQVLSQLMSCLHQISLTQIVPDVCKLETSHPKAIYVLAKSATAEYIQLLYQIALQGKRDLPHAPEPRTGVQMTLLRMLAFTPVPKKAISQDAFLLDVHDNDEKTHLPLETSIATQPNVHVEKEDLSTQATAERDAVGANTDLIEAESVPTSSLVSDHTGSENAIPPSINEDKMLLEKTRQNMAALDDLLRSDQKEGSKGRPKKPDADISTTSVVTESAEFKSLPTTQVQEKVKPKLDNGEKLKNAFQIDMWSDLINQLDITGMPKQLLLHARLDRIEDDCFISINQNSKHLTEESIILEVERALSSKYGRPMKLHITEDMVDNAPIQLQQNINNMRQQFARDVVAQDEAIQHVIATFDAKIIDDSIKPK